MFKFLRSLPKILMKTGISNFPLKKPTFVHVAVPIEKCFYKPLHSYDVVSVFFLVILGNHVAVQYWWANLGTVLPGCLYLEFAKTQKRDTQSTPSIILSHPPIIHFNVRDTVLSLFAVLLYFPYRGNFLHYSLIEISRNNNIGVYTVAHLHGIIPLHIRH